MNENIFSTDHKDIELEVTLKSGRVPPKKLKCVYFRTHDGQVESCDAHAYIYIDEIGYFLDDCSRIIVVTIKDFVTFKDQENQEWVINDFKKIESDFKKIKQNGQLNCWEFCLIRT